MTMRDITDIAVSALAAERTRMTVTASNLANAHTTRTPEGGPYRRRDPVFAAQRFAEPFDSKLKKELRAVEVKRIQPDSREFVTRYLPGHPDADEKGFVRLPNVDIVEEQANLISASRAFQANLLVMSKVRTMSDALLQVGR